MKRNVYDVPKCHLLQYRELRELPLARDGDGPRLRLEDELFERLYTGDGERLPLEKTNPALRPWAERFHGT